MSSKFTYEMLVNELTCKYCPLFGMKLIIILMCVESWNHLYMEGRCEYIE